MTELLAYCQMKCDCVNVLEQDYVKINKIYAKGVDCIMLSAYTKHKSCNKLAVANIMQFTGQVLKTKIQG